jgi:hypothetical protein
MLIMETACRHLHALRERGRIVAEAVARGTLSKVKGCDEMIVIANEMAVLMDHFYDELNAKVKFHDRYHNA